MTLSHSQLLVSGLFLQDRFVIQAKAHEPVGYGEGVSFHGPSKIYLAVSLQKCRKVTYLTLFYENH